MRAAAVSTCHGGAIRPRHQSPSHCHFPPRVHLQTCEHKVNWKPIRTSEHFANSKLCRLSVRPNAKARSVLGGEPNEAAQIGRKYYTDEQDVVTFLDPPKELIPLDPSSYNPASYLWKKIEDIPEERRHHLLSLLNPRLISIAWEVAGRRYDDAKLAKKTASSLLSDGKVAGSLEIWKCETSGAPLPISWINSSEKAIFCCTDGKTYGRLIGGYPVLRIIKSDSPLFFSVSQVNEVMSTEEPCDLAYEFGDGLLSLQNTHKNSLSQDSFSLLAFSCNQLKKKELENMSIIFSTILSNKHPWPFNDQVMIYIRHVGPGVMVGQAWQEGKALEQVPKKLCSEILMVKDYFSFSNKN